MNTKDKNSINKPMSQKEYVEMGYSPCPFCKSEDIEIDVWEIYCYSCSASWKENYEVIGYTVMQEPAKYNKIVGTCERISKGYTECPFCQNKNIVGIKEATIESPAIMQDSICSDCGMTFAAIIGYIGVE